MKAKIDLFLRLAIALILLQTLYFKFSGHPDSVYIFSKIGMEPVGRISIGVLELLASLLILTNRYSWMGALLTVGLMGGAIGLHLRSLGIEVNDDGGMLFGMAVLVFSLAVVVVINRRKVIPVIGNHL